MFLLYFSFSFIFFSQVTHKLTTQVLVLKELKNTTDEEHKTMFSEEIKTLHRLCHPNVLKYVVSCFVISHCWNCLE